MASAPLRAGHPCRRRATGCHRRAAFARADRLAKARPNQTHNPQGGGGTLGGVFHLAQRRASHPHAGAASSRNSPERRSASPMGKGEPLVINDIDRGWRRPPRGCFSPSAAPRTCRPWCRRGSGGPSGGADRFGQYEPPWGILWLAWCRAHAARVVPPKQTPLGRFAPGAASRGLPAVSGREIRFNPPRQRRNWRGAARQRPFGTPKRQRSPPEQGTPWADFAAGAAPRVRHPTGSVSFANPTRLSKLRS